MMSSYYESLFNANPSSNGTSFLFPSLFYPTPLLFQTDGPFRLYQEILFRNLFEQYSQTAAVPILPLNPSQTVSLETTTRSVSIPAETFRPPTIRSSISSPTSNTKLRRRLFCSQCSYTTNRLNNLKRHIHTMHEILSEPIECCEQLFTSKAQFRAHVNSEHRCGYNCETCRRTFCRKALLRRHQSIHSGQKAFMCRICSYSTSHKGNLDRHARVHRQQHHEPKKAAI